MSADLLPCPFCGVTLDAYNDSMVHPNANASSCIVRYVEVETDEDAAAWNRRATAPSDKP